MVAPPTDFFGPSRPGQTGGSRIFFLKLSPADAAPPYPTAGPTGRYDHPGSPRVNTPGVRAAALLRPSELQMSSQRKRVKNLTGMLFRSISPPVSHGGLTGENGRKRGLAPERQDSSRAGACPRFRVASPGRGQVDQRPGRAVVNSPGRSPVRDEAWETMIQALKPRQGRLGPPFADKCAVADVPPLRGQRSPWKPGRR